MVIILRILFEICLRLLMIFMILNLKIGCMSYAHFSQIRSLTYILYVYTHIYTYINIRIYYICMYTYPLIYIHK